MGKSNLSFEGIFEDIFLCILTINDIKDQFSHYLQYDLKFALEAFQFQLAQHQYKFQQDLAHLNNILARSIILYKDIPSKISTNLDISSSFKKIYDLEFEKFWIIKRENSSSKYLQGTGNRDFSNF